MDAWQGLQVVALAILPYGVYELLRRCNCDGASRAQFTTGSRRALYLFYGLTLLGVTWEFCVRVARGDWHFPGGAWQGCLMLAPLWAVGLCPYSAWTRLRFKVHSESN
jgi:hypothetical protein